MARQLLKSLTMTLLAVMISAVASAYGQSRSPQRATIPFGFSVGNDNFQAGEYTVNRMGDSGQAVRIQDKHSSRAAVKLTVTKISSQQVEKGKLVFHRYGDRYFLAEIWTAGDSTGRLLPMSKAERSLRHEMLASAIPAQRSEQVEIALLGQN